MILFVAPRLVFNLSEVIGNDIFSAFFLPFGRNLQLNPHPVFAKTHSPKESFALDSPLAYSIY